MKYRNIYLVLIVALLLRLVALNQSLWLDEATTAQTVKHFSYIDLIFRFASTDFHPPLYYLFMKAWTSLFGYSEIALRMPSVLFSLIAGWFVYLIGNIVINKKSGVWAAAFFLFNPLIVYYSQEARMYSMATCFLTVAVYLFIQIISHLSRGESGVAGRGVLNKMKTPRLSHSRHPSYEEGKNVLLFNIFIALSLFTFYGSIFLIIAMFLSPLFIKFLDPSLNAQDDKSIKKTPKIFLLILAGPLVALLILSPLLYKQYMHSKEMLSLVPNWSMVLGKANLKNLLLIPIKFSIGRIQFEPKLGYYAVAGIWSVLIFAYIGIGSIKNKLLAFLFFIPLILGFLISFFTPLLQYFRFVYLIPLFALLICCGIEEKYRRAIYLAGFIIFSIVYVFMPQYHRENWRALVGTIKPGQTVYMVYSSSDPVRYYLDQNNNSSKIKDLSALPSAMKEKNILVIPYTADIHGVNYQETLTKYGYKEFMTLTARGLKSEVWQKK